MLSSEIFTGGVFKPRKADCEQWANGQGIEPCRQTRLMRATKQSHNQKFVSKAKKAYQNLRGAIWGGFLKLLHYLFILK